MKNSNEKEIKQFRNFLIKFFKLEPKKRNKLISRIEKTNSPNLVAFLNRIKNFSEYEQELLLEQYDNPEFNVWL